MSKTILVIDDDKLIRDGMSAMLRTQDYQVVEAANGKEGLEAALAQHPDLIMTDIRMPEMDGTTMLAQLREDEWGKTVPVFVLTNDDTSASVNAALHSGVTTYLDKVSTDHDALLQQIKLTVGE